MRRNRRHTRLLCDDHVQTRDYVALPTAANWSKGQPALVTSLNYPRVGLDNPSAWRAPPPDFPHAYLATNDKWMLLIALYGRCGI